MNDEQIMQHLQAILYLLPLAFLVYWIAWRRGFFSYQPHIPPKFGPGFVLGAFLTFLLTQLLVVPVLSGLILALTSDALNIDQEIRGWLNLFAILGAGISVLFYTKILPSQMQSILWRSKAKPKDCLIGGITWFISYPIVLLIGQIIALFIELIWAPAPGEQVVVEQLKATQGFPLQFYLMCAAVIFIVPVVEEILFRGFLQSWMVLHMGIKKGIAISSAIFALFHYSAGQGIHNIELLVSLFILSSFLGFLYERQQSLWAPITLHSVFNAISIALIISRS